MSIHEEGTIGVIMPMMGVFNNLVIFDQHVPQNSLQSIVPELATELGVERGRHRAHLQAARRRQMARRQAVHRRRRQMHLRSADRQGQGEAAPQLPRKTWWVNVASITTNGDDEATFHLKRPQPALLALLASGVYADLSLPCLAARDAAAPDRHRPVQIRRIQAEPVDQGRAQPGLLEAGPALSRRHRVRRSSRTARRRSSAFIAGKFDMTFPYEVTIPLLKDIKTQAPQAICEIDIRRPRPSACSSTARKPPFDNADCAARWR